MGVLGALSYVNSDKNFGVAGLAGYTWVFIWFCALCFNMTYGKIILNNVKTGPLESTYYTNVLSLLPMFGFGLVVGEWEKMDNIQIRDTSRAYTLLFLSCIAGFGIAYAGWNARQLISAASYTLVGVVNKLATVLLSSIFTESNISTVGMISLLVCICSSAAYQQSPKRPKTTTQENKVNDRKEE